MIWGTELAHIISEPAIPNISKKCAVFIFYNKTDPIILCSVKDYFEAL
jgi:hypothetical protein